MYKIALQIKVAQKRLHQIYSENEYKKAVDKIIKLTNNNLAVMAAMIADVELPADIRMFALAAMGE